MSVRSTPRKVPTLVSDVERSIVTISGQAMQQTTTTVGASILGNFLEVGESGRTLQEGCCRRGTNVGKRYALGKASTYCSSESEGGVISTSGKVHCSADWKKHGARAGQAVSKWLPRVPCLELRAPPADSYAS